MLSGMIIAIAMTALLAFGIAAVGAPADYSPLSLSGQCAIYFSADAVGAAFFAAMGVQVAMAALGRPDEAGLNRTIWVVRVGVSGLLTGAGGGMVRDALLGNLPRAITWPGSSILPLAAIGTIVAIVVISNNRSELHKAVIEHLDWVAAALIGTASVNVAAGWGFAGTQLVPAAMAIAAITSCGGGILRDLFVLWRQPGAFAEGGAYWLVAMFAPVVDVLVRAELPSVSSPCGPAAISWMATTALTFLIAHTVRTVMAKLAPSVGQK